MKHDAAYGISMRREGSPACNVRLPVAVLRTLEGQKLLDRREVQGNVPVGAERLRRGPKGPVAPGLNASGTFGRKGGFFAMLNVSLLRSLS